MSFWIRNSIAVLFVVLLGSPAAADVVSRFDGGTEGWVIVSYPFRSHLANPATTNAFFDIGFGNPAGSLRFGDVFTETGAAAPTAYLGDKSAYYGGSLSYDIFLRFTDAVIYPAVVLNGGTISLYYDAPSPPLNEWATRVIPLAETGWRVSGGTVPATQAQLRAVLANLQGVYVYTEWHTGADDTSFDNVILATAPGTPSIEPAGIAALLALALWLGLLHVVDPRRISPE